jgi:hypothetical protein
MSFSFLSRLKKKDQTPQGLPIIVVSGLPRSGTSMMMKALDAGGLPVMTDNIRTADEDNPKGYYEFERVKQLKEGDYDWVNKARGKSVKIISALLEHLPSDSRYKIIFMRRNLNEILASQRQMLLRRGEPADTVSDERMADLYRKHLAKVEAWLAGQPNIEVLYVSYNDMLAEPTKYLEQIVKFVDLGLDLQAMIPVVDRGLYRQRHD